MPSLNLDSAPRKTRSPIRPLFDFLTDFRNFRNVLPADRVADFKATEEECTFTIQGVAALTVKLEKKETPTAIHYHVTGPANSTLKLAVLFSGDAQLPGTCDVQMAAHLNPFLKAMAEKPLRTLVNTIAQKISELEL